MKAILSLEYIEDKDAVVINDIENMQLFLDDGEATELIVSDNFLAQFTYNQIGDALRYICMKVALGGTITIQHTEIEILASNLARGHIDVSQFNSYVFTKPTVSSFISIEIVIDLLKSFGFTITRKDIFGHGMMIVSGVRNV